MPVAVHETVLATRQSNGLRKSRRAKYDELDRPGKFGAGLALCRPTPMDQAISESSGLTIGFMSQTEDLNHHIIGIYS